jgi:hypothetical protein
MQNRTLGPYLATINRILCPSPPRFWSDGEGLSDDDDGNWAARGFWSDEDEEENSAHWRKLKKSRK